jgi:hypothetical protein
VNVIFDSCVVDRLAQRRADPINDLKDTEFLIACTPDLREEYLCVVRNENLAAEIRDLHSRILDAGTLLAFFGWGQGPWLGWGQGGWAHPSQIDVISSIPTKERNNNPIPQNRTDAHLVALARDAIVITDNFKRSALEKRASGNRSCHPMARF